MELNQLRYFRDVAETEHMTRSARRLSVVQPALSRAIARLEEELGVELFQRSGRNIRLTSEGALFHDRVAALLDDLDAAVDELRGAADLREHTVSLELLSASEVVIDAVAAFTEMHAEVAFDITQDGEARDRDLMVDTVLPDRRTARATGVSGVAATSAASGTPGARRKDAPSAASSAASREFAEAIGVAVPVDSPYEDGLCLKDLGDERFICLAGSRRFRELCDGLCATRGFVPNIAFDSDNPAVVRKMIALGAGVGFWPEFSWGPVGEGARWVRLREQGFVRILRVALLCSPDGREEAAAFYRFLTNRMQKIWDGRLSSG